MNQRVADMEAILADKEKMRGPAGPAGAQGETGPQGLCTCLVALFSPSFTSRTDL